MFRALACCLLALVAAPVQADGPPLKLLFLGDNGPHQPALRFRQLQPALAARGIELTYTDGPAALNPQTLGKYDGLIIYANTTEITADQEKALLDYVVGGKGFIPLHCASYCFLNSPKYVELVGAQFSRHGTGVVRTTIAAPDHPVMKGFGGFESWDETYTHVKHNDRGRTVLEYRGDEPWTWVRTHGNGRVFYTAWGHDQRTWGHPGFVNLVERGVRWATGGDPSVVPAFADRPQMSALPKDLPPFQYKEAKVPFYPAGEKWGTTGKPITQMQLPLSPEESARHAVTPVDLQVKLFVSEPQIKRPLCVTWDERGRLWVAESVDYPNELKPRGQGRDRIVVCEDTDRDGRADKFTVFADKLSIPTGMAFANGGLVVLQAPDTLFLRDADGDGVADERKVLFTGWSTRDTHAGPSNLQYGLDNWLYGIVGYSGFVGEVGGERHSFKQGFFRFRPDGSKLEFLRSTNNNSWGVGISEEGLVFGSTANGNPSEYLPIPNRYYESVRGWSSKVLNGIAGDAPIHPITDKVRQVDHHGHFTAAAGHALYTARVYPRTYWNRTAFVTEPTGHLVATFVLTPDGSGFTSRNAWNLLASNDEWAAPTMAEVGPDGCVWVVDWYNFIVQHNPTPAGFTTGQGAAYETPLRDKTHGRVYRLVPRDGKVDEPLDLHDATPAKLVAALKHPNLFWRRHAQRLLVERGDADVVPALLELVKDTKLDGIGLTPGATHALWVLHGLGVLDGKQPAATAAVTAALAHPSAGVRRSAVLTLPRTAASVEAILNGKLLADPDAQVRLATLLALAEMPADPRAGAAVAAMLRRAENLNDRWIPDAAASAGAAHDLGFLRALASDRAAPASRVLEVTAVVAEHYARGGPADSVNALLRELPAAHPTTAETVVTALAKGWPKGRPAELEEQTAASLQGLLQKLPASGRGQLVKLATGWGGKGFEKYMADIRSSLLAVVRDDKAGDEQRLDAARQFVAFNPGDAAGVGQLLQLLTPRLSPKLASGLIEAAGTATAPEVAKSLTERLPTLAPGARQAALTALLRRPETTRTLLDALDAGQASLTDLALDQKQSLLAHPDRLIAARAKKLLERGGGLPDPDRQKVIDGLKELVAAAGDVPLGKAVFTKHCATCHTHGGEGNKVGPDLTGMAVTPREELLAHVFDPNRSVEGNYRVYTVTTQEGQVLTGLLASETKTSVELIDPQAKRHVVLREDIDEMIASNKSLMPEGFEKQLTPAEITNLMAFLTQKGKYLPLPLNKAATVVSTQGMFYSRDSEVERLVFKEWGPQTYRGVPFQLVDPQGGRVPNAVLLYSPNGSIPPQMPRSVKLPCNAAARAVHLLGGVSGWGYPGGRKGSVTMTVRLHYADGKTEDHDLRNGVHFADYIRVIDVPESELAFRLRGQQLRYLAVRPGRAEAIREVELLDGPDSAAPIVMAVTVETAP